MGEEGLASKAGKRGSTHASDTSALPLATLGFEPTWVDGAQAIDSLHAELKMLSAQQAAEGRKLRVYTAQCRLSQMLL